MAFAGFFTPWPLSLAVVASDASLRAVGEEARRGRDFEEARVIGAVPVQEILTLHRSPIFQLHDGSCLTLDSTVPGANYESSPMPLGWTLWIQD